ncbi:MAG: substrate-binding periplasmic protein [Bdellovibrionales bacterium]
MVENRQRFWGVMVLVFIAGMFWGRGLLVPETSEARETALQRVLRTGTLRCGYIVFAPYFEIDPKTGRKSGLGYAFAEAIGEELGVRVEWVEETGWGTFAEGLNAGRYDALCSPLWESGQRARAALLTRPIFADKVFAYVRADDGRFDDGLSALNKKGVRIADYEGDITKKVRELAFPLAQDVALSPLTGEGEYLLNVATRKADAVLVGMDAAQRYNRTATVKLKPVGSEPVRFFSAVLAVRHGEQDLKDALDSTLHALSVSGQAQAILARYPGQSCVR